MRNGPGGAQLEAAAPEHTADLWSLDGVFTGRIDGGHALGSHFEKLAQLLRTSAPPVC